MARYLFTLRGSFNKTHFVTGHGQVFVANCGLSWKRGSTVYREAKRVRARPFGRISTGESIWPHPYPGVTCGKCRQLPPPPFFNHQTREGSKQNGLQELRGRLKGGLDVGVQQH